MGYELRRYELCRHELCRWAMQMIRAIVQMGARAACSCAVVTQPTCSAPAAHAWRGQIVRREAERRGRRGGAARTEQGRARALRVAAVVWCGVGAELLGREECGQKRCRPVAGRVRYGCTAGAHQQRPDC